MNDKELIEQIKGALNTEENDVYLVRVALDAHQAELERARLIEALEEIVAGAVVHSRQEHRITNYAMNLARKAIAKAEWRAH